MIKKLFFFSILSFTSLSAIAETYYVDDTLRVGVRAQAIKSLPSLTVIRSGDKVELLSKKNDYAKIRTSNGIEGWVKSAYLSKKMPAIAKLKKTEEEVKQLQTLIADLKASNNKKGNEENASLKEKISTLENENAALQEKLRNSSSAISVNASSETQPIAINIESFDKNYLYMFLGAIVVLISMGFLFGVSWHKKQVTKRLGGLSI